MAAAPDARSSPHAEPLIPLPETADHMEVVLVRLQKWLELLLQQRAALQRRIAVTKQTILGLSSLFGNEIPDELTSLTGRTRKRRSGLTALCRSIIMESGVAHTAAEIAEQIKRRDPAMLARNNDVRASVRSILTRLRDRGEVTVSWQAGRQTWERSIDHEPKAERK
jgi:hypothetical protein